MLQTMWFRVEIRKIAAVTAKRLMYTSENLGVDFLGGVLRWRPKAGKTDVALAM